MSFRKIRDYKQKSLDIIFTSIRKVLKNFSNGIQTYLAWRLDRAVELRLLLMCLV